jgi:hypothetical protein
MLFKNALNQPLENISNYYGETIAFYFALLEFYTTWLIFPTIIGLILICVQLAGSSIDSPIAPFVCLFLAVWSAVFIEYWKRKSNVLAYK